MGYFRTDTLLQHDEIFEECALVSPEKKFNFELRSWFIKLQVETKASSRKATVDLLPHANPYSRTSRRSRIHI